jgi:hypothetical protein
MNQEILDKLHAALYGIAPLAEDRERLIAEMGETIWIESLNKMLDALSPEVQKQVVDLLIVDRIEDVIDIFDAHNVDVNAIITEVSTSVMDEVTSAKVTE